MICLSAEHGSSGTPRTEGRRPRGPPRREEPPPRVAEERAAPRPLWGVGSPWSFPQLPPPPGPCQPQRYSPPTPLGPLPARPSAPHRPPTVPSRARVGVGVGVRSLRPSASRRSPQGPRDGVERAEAAQKGAPAAAAPAKEDEAPRSSAWLGPPRQRRRRSPRQGSRARSRPGTRGEPAGSLRLRPPAAARGAVPWVPDAQTWAPAPLVLRFPVLLQLETATPLV